MENSVARRITVDELWTIKETHQEVSQFNFSMTNFLGGFLVGSLEEQTLPEFSQHPAGQKQEG